MTHVGIKDGSKVGPMWVMISPEGPILGSVVNSEGPHYILSPTLQLWNFCSEFMDNTKVCIKHHVHEYKWVKLIFRICEG